jgi:carboxyl-terminal processing protease
MQEALRTVSFGNKPGGRLIVLYSVVLSLFVVFTHAETTVSASSVSCKSSCTNETAIANKIVSLIEQGQWDQAQSLLPTDSVAGDNQLKALQSILTEYDQISDRRNGKQTKVYDEKYDIYSKSAAMIEAGDPNANHNTTFGQLRDLWRQAKPGQQKELAGTKAYQMFMTHACQQAEQHTQSANWSKAWSNGAKWLVTFEPENPEYQTIEDRIRLGDAVQSLLEVDPCQDKSEQYAQITRVTAYKALGALYARYVEQVDFQAMTEKVLQYGSILTTVLKNDTVEFACQADPNGFDPWDENIKQLICDSEKNQQSPVSFQSFIEFSDALLALNAQTLKLPEGAIIALVTEASVSTLDPYTRIVWPYETKQFDKDMTGQFGGIGIRIKKDNNKLVVTSLIPKTPAMESGLKPDDVIVAVDGELTADMSTTCAVRKISGPIGTSVSLSIQRADEKKERLISIVRDKIVLPAVEGAQRADNDKSSGQWDYFLDKESCVGYLRLNNFTDRTVGQLTKELDELEKKGLAGLVLDLRGNGGGLLNTAVDVSSMFVDQGLILKSKGRDEKSKEWKANPNAHKRRWPMVVLIDGGSASASEIVAGVLGSDIIKRAVLVGSRSYGKGTVQEVVDLNGDASRLKYTSAYYYLPGDKPVKNRYLLKRQGRDDWGIAPHVDVPLFRFEADQIVKVSQLRRRVTKTDTENERSVNEQMLEVDPQLSTALLVLKAKLAVKK